MRCPYCKQEIGIQTVCPHCKTNRDTYVNVAVRKRAGYTVTPTPRTRANITTSPQRIQPHRGKFV
jgi:hypothetical protein